jgi:hypothetical protein
MNQRDIVIATPELVSGGPIDLNVTRAITNQRAGVQVRGRLQHSPSVISNSTLGGSWGDAIYFGTDLSDWNTSRLEKVKAKVSTLGHSGRLTPVECLKRYISPTSNQSDIVIVSTFDVTSGRDPRSLSNSSFLYAYSAFGFGGPGNYWQCGNSNDFDCRKSRLWEKNPSIVDDRNVFGYK